MTKLAVNLGLPSIVDFIQDPQLASEMQRVLNAINNLAAYTEAATGRTPLTTAEFATQVLSAGMRGHLQDVQYCRATTTIAAGAPCYIEADGDGLKATPAIATYTAGSPPFTFATCFCATNGGLLTDEYGAFSLSAGYCPYVGGVTSGVVYFLSSTVAGGITATPPSAPGTFVQVLGHALRSNQFYGNISLPAIS